ncbi:MAG: L-rhamnose/proton symporter RhaT [Bacteroidales bacterium]|jgi:L-rhamnose-H+ transport protein|nr:L-rhamnose/proton symporter RhaT [Bacteroidales bacterium]
MNTILGLLIIAVGSFGQSSSYVPIKKVKKWSWETFWLTQGVFAWLVFPFLGALLAVPQGSSLFDILGVDTSSTLFGISFAPAAGALFFGILWGVGGLTFGLSMRYLGVALGQSIALGTCSAFGTLIPALFFDKQDLLHGPGLILLIGVSITLAGIFVIGYAGTLRAKSMTEEQKKAAIKDFALTKGLLVALLAGVMSACFSLGLKAGEPLAEAARNLGASDLFATLPATFMVTLGGFLTNAVYCLFQNAKNKTFSDYTKTDGAVWINNLLFCALAGLLWYSQFFGLSMGKSFLADNAIMLAFSWSILMALNVTFSNVWGILLKEWKGSSKATIAVLVLGLLVLVFSVFYPNLATV